MQTPVLVGVVLLVCVSQTYGFQVPNRRLENRELKEFRLPRATQLRQYMNESVDPCVDFYEFACGNWASLHPASEDQPVTSPLEHLQTKLYKELQDLLEEQVTRYDGNVGRRVKDFYVSCMDTEKASRLVRQSFSDFVKLYDGMPAIDKRWSEHNYNWFTQVANLRKKYGMDILIGFEIKPDYQNLRENWIYIGEPSTFLPKTLCKEGDLSDSQYEGLQKEVIDNMAYWFGLSEGAGKKLATEIFDFETILCRGMSSSEEGADVPVNTPRKFLNDLTMQFPSIDFYEFVTTTLEQPVSKAVYLPNEDYYNNLAKLMRTTSKRMIANYIMYRALSIISFPDEQDQQKRAQLCIKKSMLHFPKVIGELYYRKNYRSEIAHDVDLIWMALKEAFKLNMGGHAWIEETTSRQAIYKLNNMQLRFPSYSKDVLEEEYKTLKIGKAMLWENILNLLELDQKRQINKLRYSAGPGNWGIDVEAADIDVGYSPLQNTIRMPLGLLQPPVYHRSAPNAYKYGILGFFIAHELVHGFDENGWNFDETATMRSWWDYGSKMSYKEQVKCFKNQYIDAVREEANVSASELNAQVGEIIAENGALNISFNAYLLWLQNMTEPHILYDETLSDVDYTNTQLFFIGFAQNLCTATYSEEPPLGFFPWDVPNRIEKYRVNGPLLNLKEFSREFNCPPGIDMNPADKCAIY